MLRFIYIFAYILLNVYIILRTLRWFYHCHGMFGLWRFRIPYIMIVGGMASLVVISFFLQENGKHYRLEHFSSQWFGVLFYIIFYVAVADLIRLLMKLFKLTPKGFFEKGRFVFAGGLVVITLIISTSIYGFIHVRDMKVVRYQASIEKSCEGIASLRIVMVADQHLGYTIGVRDMEKMAAMINAQKPDLVCIAGDIFDNNYNALDDSEGIMEAFKSIESTYGVYACWGNHDVKEPLFSGFSVNARSDAVRDSRMEQLLKDAGIQVLDDKVVSVEDKFYVIGRLDYEKAGDGTSNRKDITQLTAGLDLSKPIIAIDHEPRELEEMEAAGVDIDLSGHTHGGQIFPMNLTNELIWENGWGIMQKGSMYSVVTSGIGVYGPAMRVFTDSEIVVVDVDFLPAS